MNAKILSGILTITVVLTTSSSPQTCAPVTAGLLDWWPADGNSYDMIGSNNGTIPYSDVAYVAGEVGEAWGFSGVSPNHNDTGNEVDFGTHAGNFGTNDFTIDFWIEQPTNATSPYAVLEKRPQCSAQVSMWHIRCGPIPNWTPLPLPGELDLELSDNNSQNLIKIIANKPINDGNFHHAAFVRNGLTLAIYIDGVLNTNVTASAIANISNSAVFRAGQNICVGTDGTEPFVGELDELDLYNRALSPAEIYAIYAAGNAGKCGKYPAIVTQPQSQILAAHAKTSFAVSATGEQPLYYQWSFNNASIAGATSALLTISNVAQTNLGTYSVLVTNTLGATNSFGAVLAMYPFLEEPFTGLDTVWGYTNTLSVDAWGSGPLEYQWYDNGAAIAGATDSALTFTGISTTNAGLYTVVVSNSYGSVTNVSEQVVVNPAGVSLGFSPTVTISGVVGYNYIIQGTTNLNNPNSWTTLTNLTLTQPVQIWVDTSVDASSPLNPTHFYQVLPGQ